MQSHGRTKSWKPSTVEIESKAWKYLGYQSFSKFVASDNDFFTLRRFGALTARVLLGLQDQLSQLEEKLDVLEKQHRRGDIFDIHNGSFRQDTLAERKKLISEAQEILVKYNELVLQHSELRNRPQVPKRNVCSLENWFANHENAILASETEYINHSYDLFPLSPTEKSPLRLLLERSRHFRGLRIWEQKTLDPEVKKDENIHISSDSKIDKFVSGTIMSLGLAMLIAPLWVLAFVNDLVQKLGTISAFIVLFVALVSLTTTAKPFESLAAAAAYSAVLMVFLQMSGSNRNK